MSRAFLAFPAVVLALSAGSCSRDLEGKPCPCVEGYSCCDATNVCVRERAPSCDLPSSGTGGNEHTAGSPSSLGGAAGDTHRGGASGNQSSFVAGGGGARNAGGSGARPAWSGGSPGEEGGASSSDAGSGGASAGRPNTHGSGALVPTYHNDALRTGANLSEVILTPENVRPGKFGKTAARPLRGAVYTQPLYVPDLALGGARANVVFATTMSNMVYALDADDPERPAYWSRRLDAPVKMPDLAIEGGFLDDANELGILGTPVISPEDRAMFVVSATKVDGAHRHVLHKLDLTTGDELTAPVTIEAEGFLSARQAQRSALLLSDGVVYVSFGGYGMDEPSTGWVFAYDASTLARRSTLAPEANAPHGGIWMGGQGPSTDGEYLYIATDAPTSFYDSSALGSRLLKLGPSDGALHVSDWFLPDYVVEYGWSELGTSGPVPIPGSERLVVAGNRYIYVLDRRGFGTHQAGDRQIVQKFRVPQPSPECDPQGACTRIQGSPVFWSGPEGTWMYVWAQTDYLRAYRFDPASQSFDCGASEPPDCESISVSTTEDPEGLPGGTLNGLGGMLSLSADGARAGSAIVWGTHAYSFDYQKHAHDGVLRAYDAGRLEHEIWSSRQEARDDLGPFSEYAPPTVSGGQVFVPTRNGLSGRVFLGATYSPGGPALAAFGSRLVVAWTSNNAREGTKVAWSSDGVDFSERHTTMEYNRFAPALAASSDELFLAWVDSDSRVRVVAASEPTFENRRELSERAEAGSGVAPLGMTLEESPALAYGDDELFLAWRAGTQVCMMASSDKQAFESATRRCLDAPGEGNVIAHAGGTLSLAWYDASGIHLVQSSDGGDTFHRETTHAVTTAQSPALSGLVSTGQHGADLFLFWVDRHQRVQVATQEHGVAPVFVNPLALAAAYSNRALASTIWAGGIYLAWIDESSSELKVARHSPGEVVTYGPRSGR